MSQSKPVKMRVYGKTEDEAWQKIAAKAKQAALINTEIARDVEGAQWAPHMKRYTFMVFEER